MYTHKIPKDLTCGMAMTMEIIGSKWKPCLLYNIYNGINRPGQLQLYNPKASRQVLNQQLRELEEHGIILRVVYPELPPKVEYFLTETGKSLIPVLHAMEAWGANYRQEHAVAAEEAEYK
ncbi:winged helix-turn-helix transcriptional regulator [Chitinophaga rhizophila]|uniref:Helix-turn-helix transcriptional regulator n=1 Tax=Chitinophaga rhizophila TaxID=2866212 RepID=A0ABS7GIH7_9BACT|nr:helix-turn-helix domain-containing protein [Chitinophaga rhizophila]MBW8687492.1 helix-turn-helix transcriptional regulator [Chitinophaga rhizophila]